MGGGEKQTTTNSTTQSSTPVADPSLVEQNKLDLELRKQNQQGLGEIQASGLNLGNLLLKGMGLPGYLNTLPGGISEDVTQSIVDKSLRDVKGFGQQGGLLDSGVLQSIAGRTAGDIRMGSAQFNLQNLAQLLNLALGGQAQVQQPVIGQGIALGQRLAGLTSTTQTGTNNQTTTSMNPFMKSFQTSLGTTLGQGGFGNFKAF
jgi:hypothetical protein